MKRAKKKAPQAAEPRGESLVAVRRVYVDLSADADVRLTNAAAAAGLAKKRYLEKLIQENC